MTRWMIDLFIQSEVRLDEQCFLPPSWRLWPRRVVIFGQGWEEAQWAGGRFKSMSMIHHDLNQLLHSKILGVNEQWNDLFNKSFENTFDLMWKLCQWWSYPACCGHGQSQTSRNRLRKMSKLAKDKTKGRGGADSGLLAHVQEQASFLHSGCQLPSCHVSSQFSMSNCQMSVDESMSKQTTTKVFSHPDFGWVLAAILDSPCQVVKTHAWKLWVSQSVSHFHSIRLIN